MNKSIIDNLSLELGQEIKQRADSIQSRVTGMGMTGDKLIYDNPVIREYSERQLEQFYIAIPLLQNIIDIIPDDIYKKGFYVECSEDSDKRYIDLLNSELERLNVKEKLIDLKKNERIFSNGGLLYFVFDYDTESYPIQSGQELNTNIPQSIRKIECINSVPSFDFITQVKKGSPLTKNYYEKEIYLFGNKIHESRLIHAVNTFRPEYSHGISTIEKLLKIGKGMEITLWSLLNMIYEAQIKVYKSTRIQEEGSANIIKKTLNAIKSSLSSQSALLIGSEEDFKKENFTITGFKEVKDFFWEYISAIEKIPQEIIVGQSKGVISLANNPQSINYYSNLQTVQEIDETPKVKKIIDLILKQDIFSNVNLKYSVKWNSLFVLDDNTRADIRLKTLQANQIEIDKGIRTAMQIQEKLYPEYKNVLFENE